jgi:V/A-type H+/Na+-transporting ATPase subunit E
MESKLQELTKKLYKEGVEKANKEAGSILEKADSESQHIVSEAKKKAETIIENAKKESEQLKNKVLSEIRMSSNQAISLLKQNITNLLSSSALKGKIEKATDDLAFIKELIKLIISKWDSGSKDLNLELILPEKTKNKLIDYFKKEGKSILSKGIELKFEERMKNGFKIGPKGESFVLSFTDEDFDLFFQSFLKPKTKTILFPKE